MMVYVTPRQLELLRSIAKHGPLIAADAARVLGIGHANARNTLAALVAKGLLHRQRRPGGKRKRGRYDYDLLAGAREIAERVRAERAGRNPGDIAEAVRAIADMPDVNSPPLDPELAELAALVGKLAPRLQFVLGLLAERVTAH